MEQLSGLDTLFLDLEGGTTYGHVCGLALFDPASTTTPTGFDEFTALIGDRVHLVPALRRRLVEVPLGLDQPYWIEDPNFELDFHVRRIALPAPGDDRQLAAQVGRIMSRPLDRHRPLWELYLIEGLENGHLALLTKIHHCAIDGLTGTEILATMLDTDPTESALSPPDAAWRPDDEPSDLEMLGRGLMSVVRSPVKGARLATKTLTNLPAVARYAVGTPSLTRLVSFTGRPSDTLLSEASDKPPRASFNSRVGPHRRVAFTSIPLDAVKAIKDTYQVSLNDVVLAMCAGALRGYLELCDELPADPLIALVPISVQRHAATRDTRGETTGDPSGDGGAPNGRIENMTAAMHTHVADPEARLLSIHASMLIAKDTHRAIPAALLRDAAQYSPPAVTARAARAVARASGRNHIDLRYNIAISNVPGPQTPLFGAGARLVANYPLAPVHDGAGLNITVQSYDSKLDVGIVGCRELVPDPWVISELLHEALDELEVCAERFRAASTARSAAEATA
ncbi:MAG: wax ester/triacylglycerol synthase family O-acyltransferase [Acidimicrobiia bacterium]|nr:wax ester/triacylglycerol synthase family O-acyltransferase [Acidimicrobiia bacterium]